MKAMLRAAQEVQSTGKFTGTSNVGFLIPLPPIHDAHWYLRFIWLTSTTLHLLAQSRSRFLVFSMTMVNY